MKVWRFSSLPFVFVFVRKIYESGDDYRSRNLGFDGEYRPLEWAQSNEVNYRLVLHL